MANVIINDTNLTNIANAIREKNGTTNSYKPSEMANAIAAIEAGGGGGYEPTDAELTFNYIGYGDDSSPFTRGNSVWILNTYKDRITFTETSGMSVLFPYFTAEKFEANIKLDSKTTYGPLMAIFKESDKLKEITGSIVSTSSSYLNVIGIQQMFYNCKNLRVINDNFIDTTKFKWENMSVSGKRHCTFYAFHSCYSLREVPKFFYDLMAANADGGRIQTCRQYPTYVYSGIFKDCYALNKIDGLFVTEQTTDGSAITVNLYDTAFDNCHNLSKLTFQTNADGTPMTARWTNQVIDLTKYVGYTLGGNLYNYNSGITVNNQIPNTTSDMFLKYLWLNPNMDAEKLNNRHSIEADSAKYGRTEAVETINSLPDTSAAGGNNTIKFKGAQGKYTDWMRARTNDSTYDSSISTLTDAEIAVAAAKGWTVSLV